MTESRTDQLVPDEERDVELTEDEVILPDDVPVDDEDRHVDPLAHETGGIEQDAPPGRSEGR